MVWNPGEAHLQKLRSLTISDLRNGPIRCFEATPASVTRRGKKVGYLLSPEYFEHMLRELAKVEDPVRLKTQFGLSEAWFQSVTAELDR